MSNKIEYCTNMLAVNDSMGGIGKQEKGPLVRSFPLIVVVSVT